MRLVAFGTRRSLLRESSAETDAFRVVFCNCRLVTNQCFCLDALLILVFIGITPVVVSVEFGDEQDTGISERQLECSS